MMSMNMHARAGRAVLLAGAALALCLPAGQAGAAEAAAAAESGPVKVDPEHADFGVRVDELVVTGQSAAVTAAPVKSSLKATEPQSIVTREAIDQFIPATADYTQIVNLTPSMSGTSFNGAGLGEAKSTLRGFKDGEYNITYDGVPWGDANGPTHHSTSFFPSSTIGAVVVDRGPGEANQLGAASFGGSVNLFSPEVSDVRGGSQALTAGSWNTLMSVTKLNTGDIDQLNGAHFLVNLQELSTHGALTGNTASAANQLVRGVIPLADSWKLTVLGTWNYTKINTNDNAGATLAQVALYGKNYALNNDPTSPNYKGYNLVTKHTYFNYAKLTGDVTPSLKLEDTVYSYYYKNDTESTLDPTLSPNDLAGIDPANPKLTPAQVQIARGLFTTTAGGVKQAGHIPAYTKLNVYKIYGDILHLDQDLSFGQLKAGLWIEHADTGPRARFDYEAGTRAQDFRQKVLAGVPQYLEYNQNSGWDQYQPFVDLVWNATPQLTVTPGVKYVNWEISVDADVNQKSRQPFHGSKTFEKTLYFLTANYRVRDNLSAYAQYATGILVPDISVTQVAAPNLDDLKPQLSTNYQVGAVYHGGSLTLDADAYYIEFKNKLQSALNPVTKETDQFNLGGATYKGIEAQATWLATGNLYVFANGSINSARTKGLVDPTHGITVVGGKQIAGAPESTAAVGAVFHNDSWTVSLIDKYAGRQWAAEGEPAAYAIPGYHSADLTAVYRFGEGRYRIEGAIYNLTDSQHFTNIKPGKTVPYDQYFYQAERSYQVSVKANF
jgi:iron complex outermembrane receptor protein